MKHSMKTEKVERVHDKLYLSEDRKDKPKEYFKFIISKVNKYLRDYDQLNILDIGCATGDFLYYLRSCYPNAKLTGIDVIDDLLEHAKANVPNCNFIKGDICKKTTLPKNTYDAVFINGVHSIFDDIEDWIGNALNLVSRNGKLFVFGIFNKEDVDVLVKVKYSHQTTDEPWQSGWNCFSVKSFEHCLETKGINSFRFHEFVLPIDILKQEDPLRSWTFQYSDQTRGTINGSMILHNFMLLEISI